MLVRPLLGTASLGAVLALCLTGLAVPGASAHPRDDHHGNHGHHHGRDTAQTLAVYGDAPYGLTNDDTTELDATPAFIASVDADADVSTVVHVGDIHSGKQYCTEAYDRTVADLWTGFADPVVYTPGDNEWTDCHKTKQGGGVLDPVTGLPVSYAGGDPLANLDLVRSIFFPAPGATLGSGTLRVVSQARAYDRRHPSDREYVENVLWEKDGIVFATINVPGGSNNDADPWFGAPTASPAQVAEQARRTGADLRWLRTAFRVAAEEHAKGVVLITQADMWDLDGAAPDHVAGYEPLVASIAAHTTAFKRPVLLLNGDSHVYRSDNPLVAGAPCTGDEGVCAYDAFASHPSYDVPNFHRVVVHGSTLSLEWLKLTADSSKHAVNGADSFGPFAWTRMVQP